MQNLIKGYITSLLGLIGVIAIGLHASGYYEFPNPEFLDKDTEVCIAIAICFGLFLLPYTKIESIIENVVNFIVDKFKK